MNRIRLAIGILLGAIVLAPIALSIDWQFWRRYLTRPQTAGDLSVDWYRSQVPVLGDYRPLARRLDDDDEHFGKAIAIAERFHSRALLVAKGNELVLERYWDGTDVKTRHLTFSFHKAVSALLVGAAIADGHISSVNEPVGNYIARWKDDPRGVPSLRAIMQMSAGYTQPNQNGGPFSDAARFSFGSDIESATLSGGIQSDHSRRFNYSDRSAQILGIALQNALDQPYETYLSERLWRALGARDATVIKADEVGPVTTYCCLMATAEDWAKIGILLRDGGKYEGKRLLPAEWIEQMVEPAPTNPNFGLFVWRGSPFVAERFYNSTSTASVRSSEPFAIDDVVFMDGAGGQRVYVSRALDLVVLRLGEYRADWDDTQLFNAIAAAVEDDEKHMNEQVL